MADRAHDALARIAAAAAAVQTARNVLRAEVVSANALADDPVVLDAYARGQYPDEWSIIDAPDSAGVDMEVNKCIPRFEGQGTICERLAGQPMPFYYEARARTGDLMRAKRSAIRLARERARQEIE